MISLPICFGKHIKMDLIYGHDRDAEFTKKTLPDFATELIKRNLSHIFRHGDTTELIFSHRLTQTKADAAELIKKNFQPQTNRC